MKKIHVKVPANDYDKIKQAAEENGYRTVARFIKSCGMIVHDWDRGEMLPGVQVVDKRHTVEIRIDPAEQGRLEDAAEKHGYNRISTYLRDAVNTLINQ